MKSTVKQTVASSSSLVKSKLPISSIFSILLLYILFASKHLLSISAESVNHSIYGLNIPNSRIALNFSRVRDHRSILSSPNSLGVDSNNEVPRLPVWNSSPSDRQIDFTQLIDLMGEPRGTRGKGLSELITRPKPKCNRRIRLLNGVTRLRERGSLARFQCSHGFTLIGPTTIVCLRDQWSESPPICVRSGCRPLSVPRNGAMRQSMGGAVAAFFCVGNSELIGDRLLYCDGINWNGTEPTCYLEPTTTTTKEPMHSTTIQEELWPASAVTPNLTFSKSGADSDWDINLEPLYSTTTTFLENGSNTEDSADLVTSETPILPETDTLKPYPTPIAVPSLSRSETIRTTDAPNESYGQVGNYPTSSKPIIPDYTTVHEKVDMTTVESVTKSNAVVTHQVATLPTPAPMWTTVVINAHNQVTTASVTIPPTTNRTTPASALVPVTYPRRFKIRTRRPRRPVFTRKPPKKPFKTTTRGASRKTIVKTTSPSKDIVIFSSPVPTKTIFTTVTEESPNHVQFIPESLPAPTDIADYPIAIDKEFPREQVEPIRPIIMPDMLSNGNGAGEGNGGGLGHATMIGGLVLFTIGLTTFAAGVVLYCWRKNKGIARATPYDMDGRTLSAHDANDDFMWLDQRDSGL